MPIEQPMTTAEVAAHFRKSARTILEWVRKGYIRPVTDCKPYQFPLSEVKRREGQLRTVDLGF